MASWCLYGSKFFKSSHYSGTASSTFLGTILEADLIFFLWREGCIQRCSEVIFDFILRNHSQWCSEMPELELGSIVYNANALPTVLTSSPALETDLISNGQSLEFADILSGLFLRPLRFFGVEAPCRDFAQGWEPLPD